ncbi:hypothetical protein RSAG8_12380, partial [Rhizoctonia solani AG-8 WAC10335]
MWDYRKLATSFLLCILGKIVPSITLFPRNHHVMVNWRDKNCPDYLDEPLPVLGPCRISLPKGFRHEASRNGAICPLGRFESPLYFDWIVDFYHSLECPLATCEDIAPNLDSANGGNLAPEDLSLPTATEDELIETTILPGSVPADGTTDTNSTSVGDTTLKPAVSISSIHSIVGLYGDVSLGMTPSLGVEDDPGLPVHEIPIEDTISKFICGRSPPV